MDLSSPVMKATRQRLQARFGEIAEPWWERLPEMLTTMEAAWGLQLGSPVGRGNTSLVVRCRLAGRAAILKMCPDPALGRAEATALRSWASSGRVPELWRHDERNGALVMETIPGELSISERGEGVDVSEIAKLIDALHRSGVPEVGEEISSLADRVEFVFHRWHAQYAGEAAATAVASPQRVRRARDLARQLARSEGERVLLHGDLHPTNVLDGGAGRGLVAIDPRPCVGDPAFDTVDWVIWPKDDPANWRPRSTELAARLGLDRERIWEWTRVFAPILAATAAVRGGDVSRVAAFLEMAP